MILIDGFRFEEAVRPSLLDLKNLVEKRALSTWFTVRTHRHETPAPLANLSDLFGVVIRLNPIGPEVHVNILKGGTGIPPAPELQLDPSTLLVKNKE